MRLTEIKRELRGPDNFTDEGIREDLRWQRWGFLMNAFHILNLQGAITDEMFEECTESLMWFKPIMKE
jgi:hypothetical protein